MGRRHLVNLRLLVKDEAIGIAAKLEIIVKLAPNDNSWHVRHQIHRALAELQQFAALVPGVTIDRKPSVLIQIKLAMLDNIVLSGRKAAVDHPDAMEFITQ